MYPLKTPKKSPPWLMLLILTLVSSQTWAFYQTYEMAGQMDAMSVTSTGVEAHSEMMKMSMDGMSMDNMSMNHANMNNDTMDCCQVSYDCQCPPSACSVINLLYINQNIALSFAPVSAIWFFNNNLYLNKFYSPPYRPPIA